MWGTLIKSLANLGGRFLKNRAAKAENEADIEKERLKAMKHSWLDEFWSILLGAPLIFLIIGAVAEVVWFGNMTWIEAGDWLIESYKYIFDPSTQYGYLLLGIIGAVYGIRIHKGNVAKKVAKQDKERKEKERYEQPQY